jgi:hypothetical protein
LKKKGSHLSTSTSRKKTQARKEIKKRKGDSGRPRRGVFAISSKEKEKPFFITFQQWKTNLEDLNHGGGVSAGNHKEKKSHGHGPCSTRNKNHHHNEFELVVVVTPQSHTMTTLTLLVIVEVGSATNKINTTLTTSSSRRCRGSSLYNAGKKIHDDKLSSSSSWFQKFTRQQKTTMMTSWWLQKLTR